MTIKKQGQRNFAVSKSTEEKLTKLRNYHNKTYNNLFEILVENAFLSMEEAVNLNKGKELEEQNLKVGFQVQQLTLMFSELKKELAEVNKENELLKQKQEKLEKSNTELSNNLLVIRSACDNSFKTVKQNYHEIFDWINKKDNKFTSKLSELFVLKKDTNKEKE